MEHEIEAWLDSLDPATTPATKIRAMTSEEIDVLVGGLRAEARPDYIDGGWIAWYPEMPGCISQGESEAEARENVADAAREILQAGR